MEEVHLLATFPLNQEFRRLINSGNVGNFQNYQETERFSQGNTLNRKRSKQVKTIMAETKNGIDLNVISSIETETLFDIMDNEEKANTSTFVKGYCLYKHITNRLVLHR